MDEIDSRTASRGVASEFICRIYDGVQVRERVRIGSSFVVSPS